MDTDFRGSSAANANRRSRSRCQRILTRRRASAERAPSCLVVRGLAIALYVTDVGYLLVRRQFAPVGRRVIDIHAHVREPPKIVVSAERGDVPHSAPIIYLRFHVHVGWRQAVGAFHPRCRTRHLSQPRGRRCVICIHSSVSPSGWLSFAFASSAESGVNARYSFVVVCRGRPMMD
jgi:hypothetical protein